MKWEDLSRLMEEERSRFLDMKDGCSGTLKVALVGLEKRLLAIEDVGTKSSSESRVPSERWSSW